MQFACKMCCFSQRFHYICVTFTRQTDCLFWDMQMTVHIDKGKKDLVKTKTA